MLSTLWWILCCCPHRDHQSDRRKSHRETQRKSQRRKDAGFKSYDDTRSSSDRESEPLGRSGDRSDDHGASPGSASHSRHHDTRERKADNSLKSFNVASTFDLGNDDGDDDDGSNSSELHEPELNEQEEAQLQELKTLAGKLQGHVKKYPKSGKGLFKRLQDRFIAIVPMQESDSQAAGLSELVRWKAGKLCYWETAEAYAANSPSKGDIPLLKISKVDIRKDDPSGQSVFVRHRLDNQPCDFVMHFATRRDAEEWSYSLWVFIATMRGQSVPA